MIILEKCEITYINGFNMDIENLCFKKSEKVYIIGPSGSGKSLLMKAILNLIPHNGVIYQVKNNKKIYNNNIEFRKNIAYLSHNRIIWENLTVEEHVNFVLSKGKSIKNHKESEEYLIMFNLIHRKNQKASLLSYGERQRLSFAVVLASKPEYLFLDEPYSNLDIVTAKEITFALNEFYKKHNFSVISATHTYVGIKENDRIIVLDNGKIIFEGTFKESVNSDNEWIKKWRSLLCLEKL